jgi:hypothetical protein
MITIQHHNSWFLFRVGTSLAEIVALIAAKYAENRLFLAENIITIAAGGAEIVYPRTSGLAEI